MHWGICSLCLVHCVPTLCNLTLKTGLIYCLPLVATTEQHEEKVKMHFHGLTKTPMGVLRWWKACVWWKGSICPAPRNCELMKNQSRLTWNQPPELCFKICQAENSEDKSPAIRNIQQTSSSFWRGRKVNKARNDLLSKTHMFSWEEFQHWRDESLREPQNDATVWLLSNIQSKLFLELVQDYGRLWCICGNNLLAICYFRSAIADCRTSPPKCSC